MSAPKFNNRRYCPRNPEKVTQFRRKKKKLQIQAVDLDQDGAGGCRRTRRTRRALLGDAERRAEDLQAVGGDEQEGARARRQDETGQLNSFYL